MDKRKLILDAALKLFVEFGFHATPTSKIAKEANVANGTLFHYFLTKDDLILALFTEIKKEMSIYISKNSSHKKSFKNVLMGMYLAYLNWALENNTEYKFIQQFQNSPFLSLIAATEIQIQNQPYLDLLNKGIEEKVLKPMPVDLLYILVSSHTAGIHQYLTTHKLSKTEQNKVVNEAVELLWDMIT